MRQGMLGQNRAIVLPLALPAHRAMTLSHPGNPRARSSLVL